MLQYTINPCHPERSNLVRLRKKLRSRKALRTWHRMKPSASAHPFTSFRMPAEWEPHEATWLAWPHYKNDWPGKFEPIPWVYAEIMRQLARHERVGLIVNDAASEKTARKVLGRANALSDNVRFHRWPTNRVWTRDSGCTFVVADDRVDPDLRPGQAKPRSAALFAATWRFNAWAKYSNCQRDAKIGTLMAEAVSALPIIPMRGKTSRRP